MYIMRILVLLLLLVPGYGIAYAQEGKAAVTGEWVLIKIEKRLLAQSDEHLVEKGILMKQEEFRQVTGFVPVRILADGETCSMTTARGFTETGKCRLDEKGVLWYQRPMPAVPPQEAPWMPYRYRIDSEGILVLELPQAFFTDNVRHLPVVQECTGYYKKKQ